MISRSIADYAKMRRIRFLTPSRKHACFADIRLVLGYEYRFLLLVEYTQYAAPGLCPVATEQILEHGTDFLVGNFVRICAWQTVLQDMSEIVAVRTFY